MFKSLIKISNWEYSIYNRGLYTTVISLPSEYAQYRDLKPGQYLYCFYKKLKKKNLLCFSEEKIQGTIKIKVVQVHRGFRLTVPKMVYNTLSHNDGCYYEAYHNSKGLLIFEQKKESW